MMTEIYFKGNQHFPEQFGYIIEELEIKAKATFHSNYNSPAQYVFGYCVTFENQEDAVMFRMAYDG